MDEHNISFRLFRIQRQTRSGTNWEYYKTGSYNALNFTSDPLEAHDLKDKDISEIVKLGALRESKIGTSEKFELVDVEIKTTITHVPFDSGDILEQRRKMAFEKLSRSDIEALGIEKLASYNKLKFYGSEKE